MSSEFPLYRIHVHVVKFFDELGLTPDIEIVEARLPELRQQVVGMAKWKPELLGRCCFGRLATELPRHALLQNLHDGGRGACGRFADEQVNVIGHDYVTRKSEAVAVAHLVQNLHKQIPGVRGGKQGQPPIAAASDKVQVAQSVAAVQSFRHGNGNRKAPPLKSVKDGAPQVQNHNPKWTYGNSIRLFRRGETSVECQRPGHPPTTNSNYNEYVFFAGKRIAQSNPSSGNVYYYFADHLGSTRAVTNASGTPCYKADFLPYGYENTPSGFTNSCSTNYKFTGYERDTETGNDYAFARYYSQKEEHFLSPDPLDGDATDPQTLNKYTYARNNPTNLTDPSGLFACSDCGGGGGGGGEGCDEMQCFSQSPLCVPGCPNGGNAGPQSPQSTPPEIGNSPNPASPGESPADDPYGGETTGTFGCELLGMPCGMQFPSGGGGCGIIMSDCGGIDSFTNANGNIIGDYNGEELCSIFISDSNCGGYLYWNSFSHLWQDKPTWILSQAGQNADQGVKAGMAVTSPQYLLMATPVAVEAGATALNATMMNPEFVRGFAQGVSGGLPTMSSPQAFLGWAAGRAARSQIQ